MSKKYFGFYAFYILILAITIHGLMVEDFQLHTVLVSLWYKIFFVLFVFVSIVAAFLSAISFCILAEEEDRDKYLKSHCDMMKDYILPLWTVLILFIPVCALVQLNHPWYALCVLVHMLCLFLWRLLTIYGYRIIKTEIIKK